MSTTLLPRPVPRWLHVWAILTAVATTPLLVLGGLVTTSRVGMADPIWPTAPWYLFFIDWQEPSRGFLIEHTHRLAGFTVGALMAVLALGLWSTDRVRWSRWLGLFSLLGLLASYGQFHTVMRAEINNAQIEVPLPIIGAMALFFFVALGCGLYGIIKHIAGSALRTLGVITLAGVMIQGLLGGFRVRLNAWAGTDLAAVHGIFAQFVFCLLVSLAVMTTRPRVWEMDNFRNRLRNWAIALTGVVFLQLVWGALVRHHPSGLVQRLHLMTAFVVVATAIWLIKGARDSSATWQRMRLSCILLGSFLVVQVMLGVEAWMGKFASGVIPELQILTTGQVAVRTAHVLVGTGILATSVSLALLTRREKASRAA